MPCLGIMPKKEKNSVLNLQGCKGLDNPEISQIVWCTFPKMRLKEKNLVSYKQYD